MPLNNFIPTVWSARLLARLETAHVYAQSGVVNRDYEGEISGAGDTVRINSIGPVAIAPYVKDVAMGGPQVLNDASQVLVIDQAQAFHFAIDDIDKAQQKPKVMDAAMREAAYGLRDVCDRWLAALMWPAVPAANTQGAVGAPIAIGYAAAPELDPYLALLGMGRDLNEADVPTEGRWAIIPPWFHSYLMMDNRIVANGTEAGDQRMLNGQIGYCAGFRLILSNNVPNLAGVPPTEWKIVAGVDMAVSFAEQINQVEAYRPELRFADALKGLHLYGARVVRPQALALLIANIGTAA